MSILKFEGKHMLTCKHQLNLGFYSIAMDRAEEHAHDYFEIFLIVKNSAFHYIIGEKQKLEECSLVMIRPDVAHFLENCNSNDCRFINISIHPDLLSKILKFLKLEILNNLIISNNFFLRVLITQQEKIDIERKLFNLNLVSNESEDYYFSKLKLITADILYCFCREEKKNNQDSLPEWFENILNEFREKRLYYEGLPMLNKLINRSPEYICRIFRRYLNISPTQYINNLRMEYAVVLLNTSNYDIVEISMECGLDNLSHFYHLFKKKYGVSPKKFRDGIRRV